MAQDSDRKEVGRTGEDIAAEYLRGKGYKLIEKNYRRKWGEIDIIAEKAGIVRFVEVKAVSRENPVFRPEELLHRTKLSKVARTAALYMDEKRDKREYQIDAVTVVMDQTKRIARCQLFEQVLEESF
ncbi:MAG: hypothetical protein RLZZ416_363 [Candidatus Parcubacteria bacterium]|jgi:putative endonuclease